MTDCLVKDHGKLNIVHVDDNHVLCPMKCAVCGRDVWIGAARQGLKGMVGPCCATQQEIDIMAFAKKMQLGIITQEATRTPSSPP